MANNKCQIDTGNELDKKILGWLIVAKAGIDNFTYFYREFKHKEADLDCRCGEKQLRYYLFLIYKCKSK